MTPLLPALCWLVLLIQYCLGQNINQQDCEADDGNGTLLYRACQGNAEALNNLDITYEVVPEDHTCGYGTTVDELIFRSLDISNEHGICNASNASLAHPPSYAADPPGAPTWWQSITWYRYAPLTMLPLEVNLTLALNKSYIVNSDIGIVFQSSLPRRMILEKSSDYGLSWSVYQYYADSCSYFNMTAKDGPTTPTEVICTESYSSSPRSVFYAGGQVLFDVENRLGLLTDSRLPADFQQAYEENTGFQAFLEITDLRVRLLYPATDGLEWTFQQYSLIQYYYAISDVNTFLICNCNLHGKFCDKDTASGATTCRCTHNTMGPNCQQCLPLYNNRLWRAGSTVPFPEGTANECQECTCYDHSDSCVYNANISRGICSDCRDNTAGISCDICTDGYYRNISVAASSLNSCIECNCELLGLVDNDTSCAQYTDGSQPIGQCNCRANVEGRGCNSCMDQYYGLLLDDGLLGICKDCNCNFFGTVNASNVCEKQAGQCPCKQNTETRNCGQCKDGSYGYPTSEEEDCLPCGCNPGGSTSILCNKISGRCSCRRNITSRQCSVTEQGFYSEFLDSNSYDSWDATSDCVRASSVPFDPFTGRGYQICYQGNQVTFSGVSAVTSLATDAIFYRPAIRYTYISTLSWQQAMLTVVVAQSALGGAVCPLASNTPITSLALSLPPGATTAWYATEGQAIMLDRRCIYDVTLMLTNMGEGAAEIEIDALVILPMANAFEFYAQGDAAMMSFYDECIYNASAKATRQFAVEQCREFAFAVSAEINDGGIECDCNSTGSIGATCRPFDGACECNVGVGGRRCDQCLPGSYGFSAEGCTPCNCDAVGSLRLAGDFVTGQCPCKTGVAASGQLNDIGQNDDRRCGRCVVNHYGFSTGGGCLACDCNTDGSLSLQCLESGACRCKQTITGRQCGNCVPGYFAFSLGGCTPCDCNPVGSTSATCHPQLGTCPCKSNVLGDKCDTCRIGFNLEESNPDGCQPCFCHGHGDTCSAASGFVASSIISDFTNGSSWTATSAGALTINDDGIRVTHPALLPAGASVYLLAPGRFLGEHLELYGGMFTYTMKIDTGSVDISTDQYLIVIGGRNSMGIYYTGEVFTPLLTVGRFEAVFYETNWRVVGEATRSPTVVEFQEILSSISSIRVRASFGPGTASTFYHVSMDTARYVGSPVDVGMSVTTVEQCSCIETTGTMGLSCEQCLPGTHRADGLDSPFGSCILCDCNDRSATCDPVTGVCRDCQLGTVGDRCESCAANVREPLCDGCFPDHYGFGTDLFGGACEPCNCNLTGTGGATQCDILTGQCTCTGNYGGLLCDDCQFNYFDYSQGCLRCDMCYDSISLEHARLLGMSNNLTGFVAMLYQADTAGTLGPFNQRLSETYRQMVQLVTQTDAVTNVGYNLTSTVSSLNTTMLQLLASLAGSIVSGVDMANQSLATADGLVGQALEAIVGVEEALTSSYWGISSGDIQTTHDVLRQLTTDLLSVQSQLTALAQSVSVREGTLSQEVGGLAAVAAVTVQTAEQALTDSQRAQLIHDNTTANTATLVTKANEVNDLGRRTEQAVSEVAARALQAKTAGEDGRAEELSVRIVEVRAGNEVVGQGVADRSQQVTHAGSLVDIRQTANANIVTNVAETETRTSTVIEETIAALTDVNLRYERASVASRSAAGAVASSEAMFTLAEEMLAIVQDFAAQSTGAQSAADEALLNEADIQSLNAATVAMAIELRSQLTPVFSDAQEGLNLANQVLQEAVAEGQSIEPISQRANQLAAEAATKLQSTNEIAASVQNINTTQLKPARAQCDAFTPDLQGLEAAVVDANAQSQAATDRAMVTRSTVDSLLADVQSIQQANLASLPALMVRIEQARAAFTQDDFAALAASLQQGVQEQQAWLESTQAQVDELQSQVEALDSFRVAK